MPSLSFLLKTWFCYEKVNIQSDLVPSIEFMIRKTILGRLYLIQMLSLGGVYKNLGRTLVSKLDFCSSLCVSTPREGVDYLLPLISHRENNSNPTFPLFVITRVFRLNSLQPPVAHLFCSVLSAFLLPHRCRCRRCRRTNTAPST